MKNNEIFKRVAGLLLLALFGAGLCGCGSSPTASGQHRTWESCLNQLVDLQGLSSLDKVDLTTLTTYDRTGGNNDFNNFQGKSKDAGWVILADLKGPGCIRRFWMTGTDPKHPVRIYIDGEKKPRIDSTLDDLFGQTKPWLPPLAQYINMCYYSYIPITYNKSIRIEVKEPNVHPLWGPRRLFFQISAESFPKGSSVESYPAQFSDAQLKQAAAVRKGWQDRIESRAIALSNQATLATVEARSRKDILQMDGPATFSSWALDVKPLEASAWSAIELDQLVKDIVLRVYYDDLKEASVSVPLGDFFANAWAKRSYGALWMTSGPGGYECRLPMPFKQRIRIEVQNDASKAVQVGFHPVQTNYVNGSGYLHAKYHRSEPRGAANHLVTSINGRGKFLGCFLGITGLDNSWWILEGDEQMWVDGGPLPVWRGTGMEDYFNGGWYYRGSGFGALNGNFDRAPFRVAQYRHQHPDPVTFSQSFRMEFERMKQEQSPQPVSGYFESVAYLYLEKPTPVSPCPSDGNDRKILENPNHRNTFMLELVELERSNDFEAALRAVLSYIEQYPDAEETGVYKLRALEYRRYLGEAVTTDDYKSFIEGNHGKAAQEQAKLLDWFYADKHRAIVGLSVNGGGILFLDGKMILNGDHPYNLFVTGIELKDGRHQLAAQVDWKRDSAWLQAGIRTHQGVAGTGPGTAASLKADGSWRTTPVEGLPWARCGGRDIPRGVPDAPYIGGIPNAFILVQSKSYPVSAPDWSYYRTKAYFREDFTTPLTGWPGYSTSMTGLQK